MKKIGEIEIQRVKITDLLPAKYNPRTISPEAMDGLTNSITHFGLVQPIIWNRRSKNIVGGHQRFEVLKKQGAEETDVIIVDLNDSEEKLLNIALNNRNLEGDFKEEELTVLIGSLGETELSKLLRIDTLVMPNFPEIIPESNKEDCEKYEESYFLKKIKVTLIPESAYAELLGLINNFVLKTDKGIKVE